MICLYRCKADRDQLIQVMLNISVNAIQAITENKSFLQIKSLN